jgi:hypothetical protein
MRKGRGRGGRKSGVRTRKAGPENTMPQENKTNEEIDPATGVRVSILHQCKLDGLRRKRKKLMASLASNGRAIVRAVVDQQNWETSKMKHQTDTVKRKDDT